MRWVASFASLAAMRVAGFQVRGNAGRKRLPVILAHILHKLLYRSSPTPDEPEVSTGRGQPQNRIETGRGCQRYPRAVMVVRSPITSY